MRGVHVRGDSRLIARPAAPAVAQGLALLPAGSRETAKQSNEWYDTRFAGGIQEKVSPEELQEVIWKQFFADAAQWWNKRGRKPTTMLPEFRPEASSISEWSNNHQWPMFVDPRLLRSGAALITTSTFVQEVAAREDLVEVEKCRKLCEDGLVSDAVDALDQLVQRGYRVPNNILYRVLKVCGQDRNLALGRRIHSLTVRSGYEGDAFLATHLIVFYASCGRLQEAMEVFIKVPTPSAHNWATIIFAYARNGEGTEAARAIELYRRMRQLNTVQSDNRLFSAVLKACTAAKDIVAAREVHADILASSNKPDKFVQSGLVNMYAKCGCLEDARSLFDKLSYRNVVTWNAMIAGYAQQGMGKQALSLYRSMQLEGLTTPDSITYACLLQACAGIGVYALDAGKQLHAEIRERGLQDNLIIGTSLVNMHAKCGSLDDARRLFDILPEKTSAAWNAMYTGYAQQGLGREALRLYRSMQREGLTPDSVTYVCLLQACANVGVEALDEGMQLHADIRQHKVQEDVVIGGSLVNMYAKCGSLKDARRLFDKLPQRNVVAWNAIIAGYAQQGKVQEALSLHRTMQQEAVTPDRYTYVSLLHACASVGVGALDEGKQLHAQIEARQLQEDLVLGGSLVNMYSKCGCLNDARRLFGKLREKNIVAWNAMIAGYVQQGMCQEALNLHRNMLQEGRTHPDSVTYVCLLQACAAVGVTALSQGKHLHAQLEQSRLEKDAALSSSLVNMYAKCGRLDKARTVFNSLLHRDVISWTALIAGYAQHGMSQHALELYRRMQEEGVTPNSVTYVSLLQACAALAALPLGEKLHREIGERGLQDDGNVGPALVNMYAKCGSMCDSQRVFDSLARRSNKSWGALVCGYASQGDSQVVFELLDRMKREGIPFDEITFLGVLTVCSHAGLVDKGREYFESMRANYGISATMEHFVCMVDLLGRAGHLEEALQMTKTMPFPPNCVVWHSLLGACRKWMNVEIGKQAFEGAVNLEEKEAASFVLMSNIYASTQMLEASKEMQARRVDWGAWKMPGQSWWTDTGGVVHTFVAGDKKHSESEGIYTRLKQVLSKIKREGYVARIEASSLNISDDEKEAEPCEHSEKLAMAYALNKTAEGTTIRIVKNLRLPDLRQLESKVALWLDSRRRHVWIYSQSATTTAGQGPATGATFTLSVSETFNEGRCHTACEATAGMSYPFRNDKQRDG